MAKQFEMKQSAKRAVHAFSGKTGKLDMNKLAKYQIVDDIFKRVTYLPEGKNHGINVLLDWSGSIAGEVKDLLEQSIILAEFCRKVNIPFRVYAFSDAYNKTDYHEESFSNLIEFLSSEMSSREFDKMYFNLAMIWDSYFAGELYYGSWKRRDENVQRYNDWYGETHNVTSDLGSAPAKATKLRDDHLLTLCQDLDARINLVSTGSVTAVFSLLNTAGDSLNGDITLQSDSNINIGFNSQVINFSAPQVGTNATNIGTLQTSLGTAEANIATLQGKNFVPDTATASTDNVVTYDSTGNIVWAAPTGGSGGDPTNLNGLSDVTLNSVSANQVLVSDGSGLFTNQNFAASNITGLAAFATSGSYSDLVNEPNITWTDSRSSTATCDIELLQANNTAGSSMVDGYLLDLTLFKMTAATPALSFELALASAAVALISKSRSYWSTSAPKKRSTSLFSEETIFSLGIFATSFASTCGFAFCAIAATGLPDVFIIALIVSLPASPSTVKPLSV